MTLVYASKNFTVEAAEKPHITRTDGGHIIILPKKRVTDRRRINYQDNGNWSVFKPDGPYLHIHLYGRAKSAKIQPYGQSGHFPSREEHPEFYEGNEPLNAGDVLEIRQEMERLLKEDRYKDSAWGLD